jgi:hypothetical protein
MSGHTVWSITRICCSLTRPPCTVISDRAVSISQKILRFQLNVDCSEILAQVIHIVCTWDWNTVRRSTWNGIAAVPPWTDLTRARIAYQVQEATIPCCKDTSDANGCRCPEAMSGEETVNFLGEWRGGIVPPRSRRTGHEPLSSYGSDCRATLRTQLPVSKEPWIAVRDAPEPLALPAENGVAAFCISASPTGRARG